MALPLGLNRSRSAIAFVVAEATPGVIDTSRTNSLPDKPGTADAFGLVSVPVIGQQGNYSDTSEIGPELITTDRVLNYMEYSTFDFEYYAKPGGVVDQSIPASSTAGTVNGCTASASSSDQISLTKSGVNFVTDGYQAGDTVRISNTGDVNVDGLMKVVSVANSNGGALVFTAKKAVSISDSSTSIAKVKFTLPKEDVILSRCFGGKKLMSTAHNGYATGSDNAGDITEAKGNATCVSYFLKNTIQTLSIHSRQFTDNSMQMYTASGALPTSYSVTFAKDGAVTYTSGFQANRVFYTGTCEIQSTSGANQNIVVAAHGGNNTTFQVDVISPKRHHKDTAANASDVLYTQQVASVFSSGSPVKIRKVASDGTITDSLTFEVKAISGARVTLGGAGAGSTITDGASDTLFLIPSMPDVNLTTSVIDQRKVQVFLADAVADGSATPNLLDYNPTIADVADGSVMLSSQSATTSHLYNIGNSLEVTSVNFDFDRAITTPALTEMSGESFPAASYIINEPTISGSITLLLRPKDFQLMNSLREEPRRAIGVRVCDVEGKIIEMGAASAFFEVPSPADADGATQIDVPFTVIRGDQGETNDANKFFLRYR